MEDYYKPFHQQAIDLQYKFHDSLNDANHPMAHVLAHEIRQLTEDIQSGKHPRAVEDRIKIIQHQLVEARAQGNTVLDYNHNQNFHHNYEYMRGGIRQLPHY